MVMRQSMDLTDKISYVSEFGLRLGVIAEGTALGLGAVLQFIPEYRQAGQDMMINAAQFGCINAPAWLMSYMIKETRLSEIKPYEPNAVCMYDREEF